MAGWLGLAGVTVGKRGDLAGELRAVFGQPLVVEPTNRRNAE